MTEGSILVLTGVEEHGDPWHALEATSAAAAALLAREGLVHTTTTASTAPLPEADLLVVNVSGDLALAPPHSARVVDAITEHHRRGRPLLALHSSALAFRDDERWREILGGRWVPGVTMHPQIGRALVQPTPRSALPAHAVAFERDFVVYDERYTLLERANDTVVIAEHSEDGVRHPLVWWRGTSTGRGAVVYSALGHGVESFQCEVHSDWLRATARRLLDEVADQRGNPG